MRNLSESIVPSPLDKQSDPFFFDWEVIEFVSKKFQYPFLRADYSDVNNCYAAR
jgi:hypothetical protein